MFEIVFVEIVFVEIVFVEIVFVEIIYLSLFLIIFECFFAYCALLMRFFHDSAPDSALFNNIIF